MTMKILVTGGCGFIGSNFIIKQIMQKNNTIINIDKKKHVYTAGRKTSRILKNIMIIIFLLKGISVTQNKSIICLKNFNLNQLCIFCS